MDKILEDYKAYYLTRSKRYANNPHFKRSAQAEKNLSDAMQACSSMNDAMGGGEMAKLAQLCATALLLDQSQYRNEVYTELKETIRAKGHANLLSKCSSIDNTTDLVRESTEILLNNSKEISEDLGTVSYFKSSLSKLEEIEEYENAEVPSGYQDEMKRGAARSKEELKNSLATSQEEFRKYHPNYQFNWDILWEDRHRRMIPLPDDILTKRINQIKNIIQ